MRICETISTFACKWQNQLLRNTNQEFWGEQFAAENKRQRLSSKYSLGLAASVRDDRSHGGARGYQFRPIKRKSSQLKSADTCLLTAFSRGHWISWEYDWLREAGRYERPHSQSNPAHLRLAAFFRKEGPIERGRTQLSLRDYQVLEGALIQLLEVPSACWHQRLRSKHAGITMD